MKIEIQNLNTLPVYVLSMDFDIYVNDDHIGYGYSGDISKLS